MELLFKDLEERFENKRAAIDVHISAILKREKIHFQSSRGLRNITDIVNKSLRVLKVLVFKYEHLRKAILVNIRLGKLDKGTQKAYKLLWMSKEY